MFHGVVLDQVPAVAQGEEAVGEREDRIVFQVGRYRNERVLAEWGRVVVDLAAQGESDFDLAVFRPGHGDLDAVKFVRKLPGCDRVRSSAGQNRYRRVADLPLRCARWFRCRLHLAGSDVHQHVPGVPVRRFENFFDQRPGALFCHGALFVGVANLDGERRPAGRVRDFTQEQMLPGEFQDFHDKGARLLKPVDHLLDQCLGREDPVARLEVARTGGTVGFGAATLLAQPVVGATGGHVPRAFGQVGHHRDLVAPFLEQLHELGHGDEPVALIFQPFELVHVLLLPLRHAVEIAHVVAGAEHFAVVEESPVPAAALQVFLPAAEKDEHSFACVLEPLQRHGVGAVVAVRVAAGDHHVVLALKCGGQSGTPLQLLREKHPGSLQV